MRQINILGTHIDNLSLEDCIKKITSTIMADDNMNIVTANPELIYKAQKDRQLQMMIDRANLVLPDGIGVLWAARRLGSEIKERVTGIDLTLRLLEEANKHNWRIFLLGAKPGIGEKALVEQKKRYPKIIFECHHGYFTEQEEADVIDQIKAFKPDVLLVGLGAPRQELWNDTHKGLAKVAIGIGGTIDVLSGKVQRAPLFYQNHHIEWFYRLMKEPKRVSRQRLLPLYVFQVLKKSIFHRK